jgi:hypothetical protein
MGGWEAGAAAKVMPNSSRLSDANVSDMVVCGRRMGRLVRAGVCVLVVAKIAGG